MRLTSVCGLLLMCVHGYSVGAGNTFDGSSSHNVQRRETNAKWDISDFMVTKMTVSPTWYVSEGVTVVINCTTHTDNGNYSDKMDLQLSWTKMSPGERTKKVLVSQRASKGISYVLSPVTHEHQGVYTCDDDGSFPHVYVRDWHQILWVDDASPRASIDVVSHSRSQFFHGETFTVSCKLPDDNTQWKMMRFNDFVGNITECPNQVSSGRRLFCTVRSEFPWADLLYWCETPAGERSNALNITTSAGVMVALESPSLPVLEGEDVMLRCLHKNRITNKTTSDFSAIFYRNHRQIRVTTEGNLTLTAVTKADEGIYKCRHPVDGPSYESWITVKARPTEDQKKRSDDVTKTQ